MASSTKIVQNLQAPISQPTMIPQPPEDPLLIATLAQLISMDPMQMARAAGQMLYDLAIENPMAVIGSPEILGMTLKMSLIDDNGQVYKHHYPMISRYIKHSLVGRDPRLCGMAICRIVTVQLYASGKLTDGHQANTATST